MGTESAVGSVCRDQARLIVADDVPWESSLLQNCTRLFGGDTSLHLVVLRRMPHPEQRLALTSWLDEPEVADAKSRTHAVFSDAMQHPGVRLFGGSISVSRASDEIDLPRFRDTELFQAVYLPQSRYLAGCLLTEDKTSLTFLGAERTCHDFDDDDLRAFNMLVHIVGPAIFLRRRLDILSLTSDLGAGIPSIRGPVSSAVARQRYNYWPTAREQQVLSLVTAGLTSRQIARRLEITERTVRKHLESVYRKTNLPSRAAAAAWWQGRLG